MDQHLQPRRYSCMESKYMDIQFILDPYAYVMYIASYMLKSERSMGELLKQVSKESSGKEVRSQLRLLG